MRDLSAARRARVSGRILGGAICIAVPVLALNIAGCSRKEPGPGEGASAAALNASPQITNFGVYAQNSTTLRDRTVLTGGDIGVHVAGTGPFLVTGYELALVAGVQVDTTHNTIANRVLLQGAKVGDVQANTFTVQNGGTYAKKYAFPTSMPALPTLAPVFAGTAALTVNASSTYVASPGRYGAVTLGTKSVLRLTGGVYHLASLQLDDDARIEALAPVQVRVAGRVTGRLSTLARVWIGPATGVTLGAADLRIEVSGKNGTGGGLTETPQAAVFGNDATILGVILVPNGTLQIGQRNIVTGALVGRDVYVDMDSKLTFQSGLAVLKCAQFCNDGNPCTKDTCTGEVCSYPAAASGVSCSDGNTCNGAETCDGKGTCKAGTPVTCTALDQCHAAGVCDPTTGACSNPTKADGTTCNDANACTVSDICRGGTCSGTTYSCDDALACTTDACKGDGTCTHTLAANNCLIGGACYASGAVNPTNSCQQCTPATSTSNWTSKSNGSACSDGNACTKNDICTGGSCAGTAYSCNDGVACTTDVCNGDGTCSHPVVAGSCFIGGVCYAAGAANPANPCQQCTPTTSQTAWSAKTNGTVCNDGNACTKNDVCTAGSCAGTAYSCDDGLACTTDSCNGDGTCNHTIAAGNCAIAGACYASGATSPTNQCQQCTPATSQTAWTAKSNGTACNDGNACTSNDKCTAGTCGGTLYSCDDGLACTDDACKGDGTCTHTTAAGSCLIGGACYAAGTPSPINQCQQCTPATSQTAWSAKANGTACNDGNACTQTDTCLAGACTGSNPVQCTASDQCHDVGTCAQGTGACSKPAKPDGTACDDGKAESLGDACTGGVCQGTVPCASVADVHVGVEHTCAVRTDGSLWCWGGNSLGQLGIGAAGGNTEIPVRAGAATWNWTSVTTGGYHTCGIRRDGTLWCWGDNVQGQLGNGTTDATPTPTQVSGQGWTMVQAGHAHTCGVQGDGSLRCWGHNEYGALGNGTQDDSNVPVEVVGTGWVAVAAGAWHTCGIKSDQTLWCWGNNADGQLGNGSPEDSLAPVQIGGADWSSVSVGVATGGFHTCGVKLDGGLWCWGGNAYGQLGIGSTTNSPTPVQVGSATWTNMSGGALYSCGVQGDGTLWSWGDNGHGQLGDGTLTNREVPVRVPGLAWAQVAAGNWHTCGRRQDGSLWCWGNNADGEIGVPPMGGLQREPAQVVGQFCSQVPICGNGQKEQGEECDDGNTVSGDGCTMDCQIEKCFGVVCTGDQCHYGGVCDPTTGTCSRPPKDDGTPCDDSNACTQPDTCQAGACVGSNPVACAAIDLCHDAGTCDPTTGVCSNPAKADGSSCDDGNACTQLDTCQAGGCVGSNPMGCTAIDLCHDAGTCDPTTGVCSNPAKADGSSCDDGNPCTETDTCQAGVCTGGAAKNCAASDPCHVVGACDPTTGCPAGPALPDWTPCSNSDPCKRAQACHGGVCSGGQSTCDDGDPCTVDTCSPSTGACEHSSMSDLACAIAILSAPSLQGRVSFSTEGDNNRCVPDAHHVLNRLNARGELMGWHYSHVDGTSGFSDLDGETWHTETIIRMPYMAGTSLDGSFFVSAWSHPQYAIMGVAHLGFKGGNLGRLLLTNRAYNANFTGPASDWDVVPNPHDGFVGLGTAPDGHPGIVLDPTAVDNHPGGGSALGSHVLMSLQQYINGCCGGETGPGSEPRIQIWDLAPNPYNPQLKSSFLAENPAPGTDAEATSITKLNDGRFLLAVNKSQPADRAGIDFYVSTGTNLDAPNLFGTPKRDPDAHVSASGSPFAVWQNFNFITDCTGSLWILGTRGDVGDDNWDVVDNYQVEIKPVGAQSTPPYLVTMTNAADIPTLISQQGDVAIYELDAVGLKHMQCDAGTDQCDMKAGAGAYVDPHGQVIIYASHYDNDGGVSDSDFVYGNGVGDRAGFSGNYQAFSGYIRGMEFHERHGNKAVGSSCPTLDDAWVEFYENFNYNSFGDDSGLVYRINYLSRSERNNKEFGINSFSDKASSVRWCIPTGSSFKVFRESWTGPHAVLNGTGHVAEISNLNQYWTVYPYGDGPYPAGGSLYRSISSGYFQENVHDLLGWDGNPDDRN